MSTQQGDAQVSISAKLDDLKTGLQVAVNDVRGAVAQIRQQLGGVTPAAQQASHSVAGLGGAMREFAKDQRSEGRVAGYFVNELKEILPVSETAKIGIQGLTEMLVGGAGLGLAIGGVLTLLKLWGNSTREAAAEATKAAEETRKHADKMRDLRIETELYVLARKGMTSVDLEYAKFDMEAAPKEAAAAQRLATARAGLEVLKDRLEGARQSAGQIGFGAPSDSAVTIRRRMDDARDEIAAAQKAIDALAEERAEAAKRRDAKAAADAAKGKADAEKQIDADLARMHLEAVKKSGEQVAILHAQAAADEAEVAVKYGKAGEEARALVILKIREQLVADLKKLGLGDDNQPLPIVDLGVRAERQANPWEAKKGEGLFDTPPTPRMDLLDKSSEAWAKGYQEILRQQREDREKDWEITKKELEVQAGYFEAWGQRVGATLAEVFTQGMSPLKAMGDLLKATIQQVIAFAQKEIMANALSAAAGAAKSQSGIPVVGPILAGAAMVATLGLVSGLAAKLPAAERGAVIPRGVNPVMQLHEEEIVLPKQESRFLRDLARGGAGGSGLTINASFVDASSFRDWRRRGGMDEIQREFDRRVRDGRA
jgi:hypothetical protein